MIPLYASRNQEYRKQVCRFGSEKRRPLTRREEVPGPGAYSDRSESAGKGISIKGKYREQRASDIPGPGAYTTDLSVGKDGKRGPNYSFTRDKKGLKIAGSEAPGPGNYAPQVSSLTSLGNKFGTDSKSARSLYDSPGPGAYDPKRPTSAKTAVLTSRHSTKNTEIVPGPGAYSPQVSPKAPQYSVGAAARGEPGDKAGIPGPGQYDIRPSSASAPK